MVFDYFIALDGNAAFCGCDGEWHESRGFVRPLFGTERADRLARQMINRRDAALVMKFAHTVHCRAAVGFSQPSAGASR